MRSVAVGRKESRQPSCTAQKGFRAGPRRTRGTAGPFRGEERSALQVIYPVPEGATLHRARFRQIFQTSHALAQAGCEVDLLIGRNRTDLFGEVLPAYGLEQHPNLRIHTLPMLRREEGGFPGISWSGVFLLASLVKVRSLRRRGAVPFLFTRHLKPAAFFLRFRRTLRIPVVFEAHEIFHLTTDRKGRAEKIKREESRIYPRLDGIVSITRGLAERMREAFNLRVPMAVVPDGVDPASFRTPGGSRKDRRILYVGQLYPWKGAGTLIEAMAYVSSGELHLVGGSGERIQILREKAAALGVLDRVVFHGQVTPRDVRRYLAEASVAVLPLSQDLISAHFTSPLKLFEYMAAGVPIVASDLPSTREILSPGENALLVPPEDPRALAGGIGKLLAHPSFAESLAKKALEDVQEYTWAKRAENIIRFLRSLKETAP